MGRGQWVGEVQKKYSRKGKLNEKNSCTPINPKKYSCYGLKKKKSYKEFDNEEKFPQFENFPPPQPPPIAFVMVRILPDTLKYQLLIINNSCNCILITIQYATRDFSGQKLENITKRCDRKSNRSWLSVKS